MTSKLNVAPSPSLPPSVFSADAAGRLEQAIKYMVTSFLSDGLVERAEVVSLLEDIIQMIEHEPNESRSAPNDDSGH